MQTSDGRHVVSNQSQQAEDSVQLLPLPQEARLSISKATDSIEGPSFLQKSPQVRVPQNGVAGFPLPLPLVCPHLLGHDNGSSCLVLPIIQCRRGVYDPAKFLRCRRTSILQNVCTWGGAQGPRPGWEGRDGGGKGRYVKP